MSANTAHHQVTLGQGCHQVLISFGTCHLSVPDLLTVMLWGIFAVPVGLRFELLCKPLDSLNITAAFGDGKKVTLQVTHFKPRQRIYKNPVAALPTDPFPGQSPQASSLKGLVFYLYPALLFSSVA